MIVYMKSDEEAENAPSEINRSCRRRSVDGTRHARAAHRVLAASELTMSRMTILVRTAADPMGLVSTVRNELRQMDRDQPMANVATMEQLVSDSYSRSRFTMMVLGVFAAPRSCSRRWAFMASWRTRCAENQ